MITLEELDRQLHHWQKAVGLIVANVYELYEHPVHRALAGPPPGVHVTVTGESQAAVVQACEAVCHLLLYGNELHAVVERARALREQLPRMFREEKMQQIERLLNGAAIQLPSTEVPLTQRSLLSESVANGRILSLQEIIDAMVPAFEAAKHTIFEVDRIWSSLPARLDAAGAELLQLREAVQSGGVGEEPGLLDLQRKIEAARAKVNPDPLGAMQVLEQELAPALLKARTRIEKTATALRRVEADLRQAHALQHELAETHAQAAAAADDCRQKISVAASGQPMPPLDSGQVEDADRWLAQLDAMMTQTATRPPMSVGVRRWLETCRRHLDHERMVLRANQALLDERRELRGRLDALNAKAAGLGWAEDDELANDFRTARRLLYQRPTPLQEARGLVERYQAKLNARIVGGA